MPFHGLDSGSGYARMDSVGTQIDERHPWMCCLVCSTRQGHPHVTARRYVIQSLQSRCCRPEQYGNVRLLCADDRKIPRRVSEPAFVLFEGRIVLFVDDDEAEIG